jgi:voltage-dependent calcium channel T type alpha-1G
MFIFGVVLFSAILMGLEDPLQDPEWKFAPIIGQINNCITGIFVTELVMKIIVYGLCSQDTSYMRNGWNVLDMIIVIFSITSLLVEILSDSRAAEKLELLKMLRVLRSLRMISRNEGLKLSVLSLIYSLPGILNVTVVSSLFLLLFGIFFLNILKGKFYHC